MPGRTFFAVGPACPEPPGDQVGEGVRRCGRPRALSFPYFLTSLPTYRLTSLPCYFLPHGLPPSLPNATIWCPMTPANSQLSSPSRPRVGIPWRTSHEEANGITSKIQYYFAAVTAAEGEPVPLSLQLSPMELSAQIKDLDAFVLPGAPADVNPALYRSPRHEKTHHSDSNPQQPHFPILEHPFPSTKPLLPISYCC